MQQVSDSKQTVKQSGNDLKHLVLIIDELQEDILQDLITKLESEALESLVIYTNSKIKLAVISTIKIAFRAKSQARKNLLDIFKMMILSNEDLSPGAIQAKFNPEPDLIIKVGKGLESLEGTLIIEASYAEIYFARINAQDFTTVDLEQAIEDFKQRKRNFGK